MNIKLILKIVVLITAIVLANMFKNLIAGIILGGALSVVYFSLTGSTLNWAFPKKKK